MFLYPTVEFGQREHLLWMGLAPYLVALAASADGARVPSWARLVCGVLGGLAVCVKPFHVLTIGLAELSIVCAKRSPRPALRVETVCLALTGATYVAAVRFGTAYFDLIPVIKLTYSAYDSSASPLLSEPIVVLCLGFALVQYALRPQRDLGAVDRVLREAALGAVLAYVVQNKGWFYQAVPAVCASLASMTAVAVRDLAPLVLRGDAAREVRRRIARSAGPAAVLALGYLVARRTVGFALALASTPEPRDALWTYVEQHREGGSVYIFSPSLVPTYPYSVLYDVPSASLIPAHWPLPGLLTLERDPAFMRDPAHVAAIEGAHRVVRDAIVRGFLRHQPTVVLSAVGAIWQAPSFDYVAYALKDPRFATLWADYVPDPALQIEGQTWRAFRRRARPRDMASAR
jgi:hypothetical protein